MYVKKLNKYSKPILSFSHIQLKYLQMVYLCTDKQFLLMRFTKKPVARWFSRNVSTVRIYLLTSRLQSGFTWQKSLSSSLFCYRFSLYKVYVFHFVSTNAILHKLVINIDIQSNICNTCWIYIRQNRFTRYTKGEVLFPRNIVMLNLRWDDQMTNVHSVYWVLISQVMEIRDRWT